MKFHNCIAVLAGLAAAGVVSAAPPNAAMLYSTGSGEVSAYAQVAGSQQKEQTFEGKIVKKEGQYVFEGSTGKTYMLDNQEKARQFEGKKVRVKGTLTVMTSTIRVTDIQAAET